MTRNTMMDSGEAPGRPRLKVALTALAFSVPLVIYLYLSLLPRTVGNILEATLEDAFRSPVEVSRVRISLFRGRVTIEDVVVHYPPDVVGAEMVRLREVSVTGLGGLLGRPREADQLRVTSVEVNLLRTAEERLWDRAKESRGESARDARRERAPRTPESGEARPPFRIPVQGIEIQHVLVRLRHAGESEPETLFSADGLRLARDESAPGEARVTTSRLAWDHRVAVPLEIRELDLRFSATNPTLSAEEIRIEFGRASPAERTRIAEAWRTVGRFFEKPERDDTEDRDERMDELMAALRESFAFGGSGEEPGDGPDLGVHFPAILLRSFPDPGIDGEARLGFTLSPDGASRGELVLPGLVLSSRSDSSSGDGEAPWRVDLRLDAFPLAETASILRRSTPGEPGPQIRAALVEGVITTASDGTSLRGEGWLQFSGIDVVPDPRPALELLMSPSPLAPLVGVLRGGQLADDPTRSRRLEWTIAHPGPADITGATLLHGLAIQEAATGIRPAAGPVPVDTSDPFAF